MAKNENTKVTYCEACGTKIDKKAIICPNCGLKIAAEEAEEKAINKPESSNVVSSKKNERKEDLSSKNKIVFDKPNAFEVVLYILGVLLIIAYVFTDESTIIDRLFGVTVGISLFKFLYDILFSIIPNINNDIKVAIRVMVPLFLFIAWSVVVPSNSETDSIKNSEENNRAIIKDVEDENVDKEQNKKKEEIVNNSETLSEEKSNNSKKEKNTKSNKDNSNKKNNSSNTSTKSNNNDNSTSSTSSNNNSNQNNIKNEEEKKGDILFRFYDSDHRNYKDYWLSSGDTFTIPNNNYSKQKKVNVTYYLYLDDIHYNEYKTYYSYTTYAPNGWKLNNSSVYKSGQKITVQAGNWVFTPNFSESIECAKVPTPSREGYIFTGWSTSPSSTSGTNLDFCGTAVTTSKWYAAWKPSE